MNLESEVKNFLDNNIPEYREICFNINDLLIDIKDEGIDYKISVVFIESDRNLRTLRFGLPGVGDGIGPVMPIYTLNSDGKSKYKMIPDPNLISKLNQHKKVYYEIDLGVELEFIKHLTKSKSYALIDPNSKKIKKILDIIRSSSKNLIKRLKKIYEVNVILSTYYELDHPNRFIWKKLDLTKDVRASKVCFILEINEFH